MMAAVCSLVLRIVLGSHPIATCRRRFSPLAFFRKRCSYMKDACESSLKVMIWIRR